MSMNNPYNQYKTMQIGTASQGSLILMLYEAAIRNLRLANAAINAKKINDAHKALVKSQDIITELKLGLNMEAGEIAANLASLYTYMNERLITANMQKNTAIIEEVMRLMSDLQEAWETIIKKQKVEQTHQGINHGV